MPLTLFNELLSKIAHMSKGVTPETLVEKSIVSKCQDLLTSNSEVANLVRAQDILRHYKSLDTHQKHQFFMDIFHLFGVDEQVLLQKMHAWMQDKNAISLRQFHFLSEPASQNMLRTLNFAPNATLDLVNMRQDLLQFIHQSPELKALDNDFLHLFKSWFNRGFLHLKRIDWSSAADTLEKLIAYEAVHEIKGWEDLRQRVGDSDRALYAYFHPALGNEPLIFVQVALMHHIPSTIQSILSAERQIIDPYMAKTAVFYSISNCQQGLKGVSFGNFLIKQVVENIRQEFPNLQNFVTLSPVPKFKQWATQQLNDPNSILSPEQVNIIEDIHMLDSPLDMTADMAQNLQQILAIYIAHARHTNGKVYDSVARFHLGNGAELYDIHPLADTTHKGLSTAWGCMVNYAYHLKDIEQNHDTYYNQGKIALSNTIAKMLPPQSFPHRAGIKV